MFSATRPRKKIQSEIDECHPITLQGRIAMMKCHEGGENVVTIA